MTTDQALKAKQRGNALFSKGEWENAISEFSEAIKLDPKGHVYYSNRSACYAEMGNYENALQDAEKCIELNSTWPKGYSRKGHALFKLGRFEEASYVYKEGLKIDPENTGLKENLKMAEDSAASPNPAGNNPFMGGDKNMDSIYSNLKDKIQADPEMSSYMDDPEFVKKIDLLQKDPQKNLPDLMSDPRMMKVFQLIMKEMGLNLGNSVPQGNNQYNYSNGQDNVKTNSGEEQTDKAKNKSEKTSEQKKAEEKKQQGNSAYKKQSFDEAIAFYSEAIGLDPKNIVYLTNRATVKMAKGDYDGAKSDCEEAIKIGRANFSPFKEVGKAMERLGDIAKREKRPKDAIKHYNESLLEFSNYDVKKKLRDIEDSIKESERRDYLDPELGLEHRKKGNEFFGSSKWQEALNEYTESIKRNPNDAKAFCNRAAVYSKLMAWEYALNDCKEAIRLDKSFAKAYLRKGKIEHYVKDFPSAIQTFNEGLKYEPGSTQLMQSKQETMRVVLQMGREGKFDKEHQTKAMQNKEVQKLMNDPELREVLESMKKNTAAGQAALGNPEIMKKLEILMAAGVVQMG